MSGFARTIQLAMKSLLLQPLRSGLTMLGIVFGVFSVIAMLAIGEGASTQAQEQVLQLGANNVIVRSVKPPLEASTGGANRNSMVLTYGLKRSDLALLESIPTVEKAVPVRETSEQARHFRNDMNVRVVGCTADYLETAHLELFRGRWISERDEQDMRNVAVIAAEVAEKLFGAEDPRDKAIRVGSDFYTVVGVTKERTASAAIGGSMSGQDFNKDVYIPLRTFFVRIGDLKIQRATGSFTAEQIELNQITLTVDDPQHVVATAEVVRETLSQTHDDDSDYAVVVPLELLEQAKQLKLIFNVVLGSIAAISLLVGGIGIMNIMLATVTERTREIGIRRALGARQKDITNQFLTETVVLSGTGGLIGVLLGLATPVAFVVMRWLARDMLEVDVSGNEMGRIFSEMEPTIAWWSLPLAFGFSVVTGVVFGLYPARSAARLHPIEALRHE